MNRFVGILCLFAVLAARAELPPAPQFKGEIKRNAEGRLVLVSEEPDSQPICAAGAITCIEAVSTGDQPQPVVPLTFGQPFKAGDLPKGSRLVARDVQGSVPVQIDEQSSHVDGSSRFAVVSLSLSHLAPGERRIVDFFRSDGEPPASAAWTPPAVPGIKVSATLYSPQISEITFGNRHGTETGLPFAAGEVATLQLGDSPDERFSLTITPELAGGHHPTLTKIAYEFMRLVNEQSRRYKAFKIGGGGGYEKLWITTVKPDAAPFAVKLIYSGQARFKHETLQRHQPPQFHEATPGPAFERLTKGEKRPRLEGQVAREYVFSVPMTNRETGKPHPQLTARFAMRFSKNDPRVRTDLSIENAWAYEPEPGNLMYELTVTQDDSTLHRQEVFTHYHHARWHKVFWTAGDAPRVRIRHHMPYFLASRATWNYDLTLRIPEHVLSSLEAQLEKSDTRPMAPAMLTQHFGTTGGRSEIGPLPKWTALYLISQDARALRAMLAIAAAAAGVPIHYRDKATGLPVSLEDHPGISTSAARAAPRDAMPVAGNDISPWTPDLSHQGSFAYIPYLITGDLFYQEEIAFWATFNMMAISPGYRGHGQGLINAEQIRGQAWALRSLGEAARALPDAHPMKRYFQKRLTNNLEWYEERHSDPEKSGVSPLGCLVKGDQPTKTAPWQDDFMTIVVAQLAENGENNAASYLRAIGRCTTERWLHEPEGFCRRKSAGYWIEIRHRDGRFMRDWPEVFRANWPDTKDCQANQTLDGDPGSPSGYVAYALAALALAADAALPGADAAYTWLSGQTPAMKKMQAEDPTWAIVPRTLSRPAPVDR
jgi:hypothetical protein